MRLPLLSALLLCAAACTTPRPSPDQGPVVVPSAPALKIPAGCGADLSGDYQHARDESFLYSGVDDGGTLTLQVARRHDGGAFAVSGGDGGTRIVLERTAAGFVGETRAHAFARSGAPCPVDFKTEVLGCDGGLLLRSDSVAAVDDTCRLATPTRAQPSREHLLRRVVAPENPAPLGGVDAG